MLSVKFDVPLLARIYPLMGPCADLLSHGTMPKRRFAAGCLSFDRGASES